MRNNSRLYLYIGAGALVIVVLSLTIMSFFRDDTSTAEKNKQNRYQEENIASDNKTKNDEVSSDSNESNYDSDVYDTTPDGSRPEHPIVSPQNLTGEGETETEEETDGVDDSVDATTNTYTFNEGSILQWPVSGNIIMNYSMDKMVYFATLDSYKYNPAIFIQATEGTPVVAGATGEVISIENEADTGLTVGMRIGTEFVIYYGQLKDCGLAVGDHVNRGETIANVAAPTKYYLVEGPHLYVRMERNDEPVNPLSYLDFSE